MFGLCEFRSWGETSLVSQTVFAMVCFLALPWAIEAAEFHVAKTADTADIFCIPGPPAAPPFDCSLREAIIKANTLAGPDIIFVPPGHYVLTRAGAGENLCSTGDLDIMDDLTIVGEGPGVIIDAGGLDRVFQSFSNYGSTIWLHHLTIRGGDLQNTSYEDGAGILQSHGRLFIVNCLIEDNTGKAGVGFGGGIHVVGGSTTNTSLIVIRSTFRGNSSSRGGAIHSYKTSLTIDWSTITDNAGNWGAAIYSLESAAAIRNSTITGNGGSGDGVIHNIEGPMLVQNCTLANPPVNFTAEESDDSIDLANNIIGGGCEGSYFTTLGGNIEGPGDTCNLQNPGDYSSFPISLMALDNYGGPTMTRPPSGTTAALAVDNPWANPDCYPDDQRGLARPIDGNGDGTADCDTGSVEWTDAEILFLDGFESRFPFAWSATVG